MYVQFYEKPHGGFKTVSNFSTQIQNEITSFGLRVHSQLNLPMI